MRVRALTSFAAGHPAHVYGYGQMFDLPSKEALPLIAAGHIEAVDPEPVAQVAPKPEPETATVPPKGEQAVRLSKRGR